MNIYDVFVVCDVTFEYNYNLKNFELSMYDIITGSPIIVSSVINIELNKYIKSYMDHTEELPMTISLFGHFVRDSKCIYVMELDSMQIMNIKSVNCYLYNTSNGVKLIDENTRLPIHIIASNSQESNNIAQILTYAYNDENSDFSLNGNDRITCMGIAKYENNHICFNMIDKFLINTPERLTQDLYMHFMQSEFGINTSAEDS